MISLCLIVILCIYSNDPPCVDVSVINTYLLCLAVSGKRLSRLPILGAETPHPLSLLQCKNHNHMSYGVRHAALHDYTFFLLLRSWVLNAFNLINQVFKRLIDVYVVSNGRLQKRTAKQICQFLSLGFANLTLVI